MFVLPVLNCEQPDTECVTISLTRRQVELMHKLLTCEFHNIGDCFVVRAPKGDNSQWVRIRTIRALEEALL